MCRLLDMETTLSRQQTRTTVDEAGAQFYHRPALVGGIEYLGKFFQFQAQNIICLHVISGAHHSAITDPGNSTPDPLGEQCCGGEAQRLLA